jgi:hypothetical protein
VAAGGAITLLRFAEREVADVVYLDQFAGALYLDKPADVQHYGQGHGPAVHAGRAAGRHPGVPVPAHQRNLNS